MDMVSEEGDGGALQFDQGDFRLKGMLTEVSWSHLKFGQVLAMLVFNI